MVSSLQPIREHSWNDWQLAINSAANQTTQVEWLTAGYQICSQSENTQPEWLTAGYQASSKSENTAGMIDSWLSTLQPIREHTAGMIDSWLSSLQPIREHSWNDWQLAINSAANQRTHSRNDWQPANMTHLPSVWKKANWFFLDIKPPSISRIFKLSRGSKYFLSFS